jgi:hypothetical protein
MIELDSNAPYPGRAEVRDMISTFVVSKHEIKDLIRKDAINRFTAGSAVVAALASVIAVILAVLKPASNEQGPPNTSYDARMSGDRARGAVSPELGQMSSASEPASAKVEEPKRP